jgi:hypothetical protein
MPVAEQASTAEAGGRGYVDREDGAESVGGRAGGRERGRRGRRGARPAGLGGGGGRGGWEEEERGRGRERESVLFVC